MLLTESSDNTEPEIDKPVTFYPPVKAGRFRT